MSDHSVDFIYEYDSVRAKLVCHAPADAACRSTPSCDCESFSGPERDEQGWYHEAIEFIEGDENTPDVERDVEHRHTQDPPGRECSYQVWINADSPMECGPEGKIELTSLPVDMTWEGDFYSWAPHDDDKDTSR